LGNFYQSESGEAVIENLLDEVAQPLSKKAQKHMEFQERRKLRMENRSFRTVLRRKSGAKRSVSSHGVAQLLTPLPVSLPSSNSKDISSVVDLVKSPQESLGGWEIMIPEPMPETEKKSILGWLWS